MLSQQHKLRKEKPGENGSKHVIRKVVRKEERNRARHLERVSKFQKQKTAETQEIKSRIQHFLRKNHLDSFCESAIDVGLALRFYSEHNKVKDVILDLVKPIYPNAKIHFFGSRINGLGTIDSDLDIFLELETPLSKCYNVPKCATYIETVKSLMNKDPKTWKALIAIKDAKVPIIKVHYAPHSLECDISFSSPYGYFNTTLINHLINMQPVCYKMCMILKHMYKLTHVYTNNSRSFSTYSLIMMIFFYMQTKRFLPSISSLQSGLKKKCQIGCKFSFSCTFT